MLRSLTYFFLLCAALLANLALAQLTPRTSGSLDQLDNSIGRNRPLPLEQAFPYFLSETSPGHYRVTWDPAPGHYLYRHAFSFSLKPTADAQPVSVEFTLPNGLKKTDQFFGEIEAYYEQVSAEIILNAEPGPEASLIIEYQGCADWGFCYPPQRSSYKFTP